MRRQFALTACLCGMLSPATGAGQDSLGARFPPPPGVSLLHPAEEQSVARAEMKLGATEYMAITGRYFEADYEFTDETRVPLALDTLRYYRALLIKAGGREVWGSAGLDRRDGGGLTGRVGGERPLWLSVEIGSGGTGIKVVIVEEEAVSRSEFPLSPDRIPGAWTARRIEPHPDVPQGLRADIRAYGVRVDEWLRAMPSLASPTGANLWVEFGGATGGSGPEEFSFQLYWRNRFQDCDRCEIGLAVEYGAVLTISVNRRFGGYCDPDSPDLCDAPTDGEGRLIHAVEFGEPLEPGVGRLERGYVVARQGVPEMWRPLNRETLLEARIRYSRAEERRAAAEIASGRSQAMEALKTLEKLDPAAAANVRKELAAAVPDPSFVSHSKVLEAELAALSPRERAEPACLGNMSYAVLNPAFVAMATNRATPYVVRVEFDLIGGRYHRADVLDRLRSEMTPERLRQLVQ